MGEHLHLHRVVGPYSCQQHKLLLHPVLAKPPCRHCTDSGSCKPAAVAAAHHDLAARHGTAQHLRVGKDAARYGQHTAQAAAGGSMSPGDPSNSSASRPGRDAVGDAPNAATVTSDAGTGGAGGNAGGSAGGSGRGGGPGSSQPPDDQGDADNTRSSQSVLSLPFSKMQLSAVVVALSASTAVLLAMVMNLSAAASSTSSALSVVTASLEGMADGASTRDSVAALKRLLREVFAEQLGIKQRLEAAEKAASTQLEAADDFQTQLQAGSSSSGGSRAPVRMTGEVFAAGVLPWSQEASGPAAVAMLTGLGASGAADVRLQLHSVLAGGKRRITAEFDQAAQDGPGVALRLQRLLYRVQVCDWMRLLIAPLGGSLDVLSRGVTPVRGDYGCTSTFRRGHGLSVLQNMGSGKAVCLTKRQLSASAGFFVGGGSSTRIAMLQASSREGHSLSLIAAHCRCRADSTAQSSSRDTSSVERSGVGRLRFLGVQSPRAHCSSSQQLSKGPVLGVAGVLPVGDAFTATAWTERPMPGQAGWGMGLYCQPDRDGVELGMVLGKPSSWQHSTARGPRPLFCEVSAKVPVGEGLSISPGALVACRGTTSTLAYMMQSSWKF